MKRWYHIAIAFVLLVGLAYYIDYDLKKQDQKTVEEEKAKLVFDLDWQNQRALIVDTNKAKLRFEPIFPEGGWDSLPEEGKAPDKWEWKITQPLKADAAVGDVQKFWQTLSDLKLEKEIQPEQTNLSNFGLDRQVQNVLVFSIIDNENNETNLYIGDQNPAKTGNYAMLDGKPGVYLVEQRLNYLKDKPVDYFRQKEVLKFDNNRVTKVEYRWDTEKPFTLVRNGSDWLFEQPFPAFADSVKVNSMLQNLKSVRAEGFPSENASKELKKYFLDKPRGEVTLHLLSDQGNEEARAVTLYFGRQELNEPSFYMYRSDGETVYKLKKFVASNAETRFNRLMDLDIADFVTANIERVEIINYGNQVFSQLTMTRNSEANWDVTSGDKKLAVNQKNIEEMMRRLQQMAGNDFIRRTAEKLEGFDAPLLEVKLVKKSDSDKSKSEEPIKLVFAKAKKGGKDFEFFAQGGRNGHVFSVNKLEFEQLYEFAQGIIDQTLVPNNVEEFSEIEIESNKGKLLLKKGSTEWQVTGGDASAALSDSAKAGQLVSLLSDLKMNSLADASKVNVGDQTVRIKVETVQGPREVFIGQTASDGRYPVKLSLSEAYESLYGWIDQSSFKPIQVLLGLSGEQKKEGE